MSTPLTAVVRIGYPAVVSLLTLVLLLGNVRLYATDPPASDIVARLKFLENRLRAGSAERMQRMFPEGYAFSYALYGLAWTNVASTEPGFRARALEESRWALRRLESPAGRAPFDAGLTPRYGVFHAGWSTLLRARIVQVAGSRAPEARRLAADAAELATAFRKDGPFLQAYPGQSWPVDSVVAMAALRLHDRVLEPRHRRVVDDWVRQARAHLDPATGLLPHRTGSTSCEFERDCEAVNAARGTSQSVIQRFLPLIDQRWAASQYQRFRDRYVAIRMGLPGVLEYPEGHSGPGDVDSGPLILGVSASASVVTIGAARANGDLSVARELNGLGEALGMPLSVGGGKRYAFGALPIGDAFLAWAASTPVSGTPTSGAEPSERFAEAAVPRWWRLPWHGLSVLLTALLWYPVARALRARGEARPRP